jgi:hypothetical protein
MDESPELEAHHTRLFIRPGELFDELVSVSDWEGNGPLLRSLVGIQWEREGRHQSLRARIRSFWYSSVHFELTQNGHPYRMWVGSILGKPKLQHSKVLLASEFLLNYIVTYWSWNRFASRKFKSRQQPLSQPLAGFGVTNQSARRDLNPRLSPKQSCRTVNG